MAFSRFSGGILNNPYSNLVERNAMLGVNNILEQHVNIAIEAVKKK